MTTEYTILLSFLYLLFIATAYCPKKCKVSPATKIEYFPDVPDVELTEPINPSPAPIVPIVETAIAVTEPEKVTEPIATAIAVIPAKNALINPVTDLKKLTIRELKRMASEAKIKRYNVMKKGELILALS
jgi:hypothetical protein